jgi:hypothetical protein
MYVCMYVDVGKITKKMPDKIINYIFLTLSKLIDAESVSSM